MDNNLYAVFEGKRKFFDEGHTKSYEFRIAQLNKLKAMVQQNEEAVLEALYNDLHKPEFEAYISEIGVLYEEINTAIKNLKNWMKPQKVKTALIIQPSESKIYYDPLGVVLIIGPWNYPFQLLLAPLVGAIAAGNCAILKPSDQTSHVSELLVKIIGDNFSEDYISVVQGKGEVIGPMLINEFRFDHIFFTGSINVGKKIAEMAARHLTPVTLELGGKSPAIVMNDANLKVAAKRLVWAKFFNAGQTCVAPDYVLVEDSVKNELIENMKEAIKAYFGENPEQSESYGRIINARRVENLKRLMNQGRIISGGRVNEADKYIEPTLIDGVSIEDPIMQEEIFGPLLPIITFTSLKEALEVIRKNRYPLSLYLYTQNEATEEFFLKNVEFGGGCINNSIVHLVNSRLPFGGVGYSGMGNYHGKYSFETFSHRKSVVKSKTSIDPNLRYAPYKQKKLNIVKWFMT